MDRLKKINLRNKKTLTAFLLIIFIVSTVATVSLVSGTTYFSSGFEYGDFTGFDYYTGGSVQSTVKNSGTYAALFPASETYCVVDQSAATQFIRGYFRITALPAEGTNIELISMLDSSYGKIGALSFSQSSGSYYLELYSRYPAEDWNGYAFSLQVNTWYCVELKYVQSATVGEYRAYLDGTEVVTLTGLNTNAGVPAHDYFGRQYDSGTANLYVDDVEIASAYIGPLAAPTPTPTASPTPTATPTATPTPTPTAPPGSMYLHTSGTDILDAENNPVILRGVADSITTWWDGGVGYNDAQMQYMAEWGCNSVRITVGMWDIGYTPGSIGVYSDSAFLSRLDSLVYAALDNGMYPIIEGWHAVPNSDGIDSTNVGSFMTTYHTWTDYRNAYAVLAQRYAGLGVIYEMYNEPLYCSWSTYKTQMEACIDVIRTYDPLAMVIVQAVGSGSWDTQSLQFVGSYPIEKDNVVYSAHIYSWQTLDNSESAIEAKLGNNGAYTLYCPTALSAGYPVTLTEFGCGGNGEDYDEHPMNAWSETWLENMMTYCDANSYSGYNAWRWCTSAFDQPYNLLADWVGTPSTYGQVIYDYYITANPPTPTSYVYLTINAGTGGYTNPAGNTTYTITEGQTQYIYAYPASGYIFDRWNFDGTTNSTTNPYYLLMNANHTVTAYFNVTSLPTPTPTATATPYPTPTSSNNITLATTTGGTTNPAPGNYTYYYGEWYSAYAVPNSGYAFSYWNLSWTTTGTLANYSATYTTNPFSKSLVMNGNATLTAYFTESTATPTPTANPSANPTSGERIETINVQPFWQYLYAGNALGFFQAIFLYQFILQDILYGALSMLFFIPLYLKTRSVMLLSVLWILVGAGIIVAMPSLGLLALLFLALGIGSVLWRLVHP